MKKSFSDMPLPWAFATWCISGLQVWYFAHAISEVTPSFIETANAMKNISEFGITGLLATTLFVFVGLYTGMWGLVFAKTSEILLKRM